MERNKKIICFFVTCMVCFLILGCGKKTPFQENKNIYDYIQTNREDVAQSFFVTNSGSILGVDIVLARKGTSSGSFKLVLKADEGGTPFGNPIEIISIPLSDITDEITRPQKYRINFSGNTTLQSYTQYWIYFPPYGDENNYVAIYYGGDTFLYGNGWSRGSGNNQSVDLTYFNVYVQ